MTSDVPCERGDLFRNKRPSSPGEISYVPRTCGSGSERNHGRIHGIGISVLMGCIVFHVTLRISCSCKLHSPLSALGLQRLFITS